MCFGTAWVTCYALSKVLSKLNISIEIKKKVHDAGEDIVSKSFINYSSKLKLFY